MYRPMQYAKINSIQLYVASYVLEKYRKLIKVENNSSILDLGMGDGKATEKVLMPFLSKSFKEVVGVDISEEMVEYTRKNGNLSQVAQLDIATPHLPDEFKNRFDNIFSFHVLHWIKDVRQVLQNAYDMLRPGGSTFFIFCTERPDDEAMHLISKMPRWEKYEVHKFVSLFYNRSQEVRAYYEQSLEEIGFIVSNMALENLWYTWENEELFEGCFKWCNQAVELIDENDLDDYFRDLLHLIKNGSCHRVTKNENSEEEVQTLIKFAVLSAQKPS